MLRVLGKIFGIHTVAGQNAVAVKLIVFLDDLLRRAADFAIRTRAVEHPIDDAPACRPVIAAVFIAA